MRGCAHYIFPYLIVDQMLAQQTANPVWFKYIVVLEMHLTSHRSFACDGGDDMRYRTWLLTATLLSLFASAPAFGAVVTIENPKRLPVDEAEVNLLYTMTCREIAEAYHVRNYKDLQVPVTLVLGGDDERYVIDHLTGAGTIYLKQWIEQNFVAAAVMIAFHRVLSNERFKSEVTKILIRFQRVKPQTVTALRRSH